MIKANSIASASLIEELASDHINILRVKQICRENPGLIASAGLRVRIWTLLLLGKTEKEVDDKKETLPEPKTACNEQHVLEADIHRTRSDVESFRSTGIRKTVGKLLQHFCLTHGVQYKQGMNEVLAPFVDILPPEQNGEIASYSLFEGFMFRYLERFFCVDDSTYLFKSFRFFHLLLVYFDPQLAEHLQEQGFPPELYSPQWFLTLYSRALPLPQVHRLWDMFLCVDDPAFTFYIGLCLLRRRRDELLLADVCKIPEIVQTMRFKHEEEIDTTMIEAYKLYSVTPKSFVRHLRLCCVSTAELTPLPKCGIIELLRAREAVARNGMYSPQDKEMSVQSVRSCVMLTAQELINSVAPLASTGVPTPDQKPGSERDASKNTSTSSSSSSSSESNSNGRISEVDADKNNNFFPQQYVILDIRTEADSMGGVIPRAISLDPEFLKHPEAFEIWLQHFDGTRGCNICIIDMPPAPPAQSASSAAIALWRRLLLGEGDGVPPKDGQYTENISYPSSTSGGSGSGSGSILSISSSSSSSSNNNMDEESRYAKDELIAATADTKRAAVQLAQALQKHSFSHISVLDGGFPALVEQLLTSRGKLEPVIINHSPEAWRSYLKSTGRDTDLASYDATTGTGTQQRKKSKDHKAALALLRSSSGGDLKKKDGPSPYASDGPRSIKELDEVEVLKLALVSAVRLKHTVIAGILRERLEQLTGITDVKYSTAATATSI